MKSNLPCYKVYKFNTLSSRSASTLLWEQEGSSKMSSLMTAMPIILTFQLKSVRLKTKNNYLQTHNFSGPSRENLKISKRGKEVNCKKVMLLKEKIGIYRKNKKAEFRFVIKCTWLNDKFIIVSYE